jgi:hypothetical protein
VRKPTGSVVDKVKPEIRALLKGSPEMPATVIADRLAAGVDGAQGAGA